jgi:hypothetical protein
LKCYQQNRSCLALLIAFFILFFHSFFLLDLKFLFSTKYFLTVLILLLFLSLLLIKQISKWFALRMWNQASYLFLLRPLIKYNNWASSLFLNLASFHRQRPSLATSKHLRKKYLWADRWANFNTERIFKDSHVLVTLLFFLLNEERGKYLRLTELTPQVHLLFIYCSRWLYFTKNNNDKKKRLKID